MAIPVRTNLIDVTKSPYNADNTGAKDATAAIQAAINAATSNSVVWFPSGKYLLSSSALSCQVSYITLRGAGATNSILILNNSQAYGLIIGRDPYNNSISDYISSGATQGSTNLTLTATPNESVGQTITISESTTAISTTNLPFVSSHQWDHILAQEEIVTSVSGNKITVSDPLMWNFTNGPVIYATEIHGFSQIGIESLGITDSNMLNGVTGGNSYMLALDDCVDCWVTNCALTYGYNYDFMVEQSSHISVDNCILRYSLGSGPDHAGLVSYNTGGSRFENCIYADGLQPGIEFDGGCSGNAFFGNFFTNNILDADNHNPHTMMNLFEENIMSTLLMDGFFGSSSHHTLLRDWFYSNYCPLEFKRWTTHMNVVGNVLGISGATYHAFQDYVNGDGNMILQSGFPNIGNSTYFGTSLNIPYNFPLTSYPAPDGWNNVINYPLLVVTKNQGPTNVIQGTFGAIPTQAIGNGAEFYSVIYQDAVNTNLVYPTNGVPIYIVSATSSALTLSANITVVSGQNLYLAGQSTYQQVQTNDLTTDNLDGNYDYFHKAVTWNSGGAQTIPTSLLYTNGQPSWWGTNRWPAIDPLSSPMVAIIPAEYLYVYGRPQGVALTNANPVISVTPASQSFGTVAIGTPANQTFTVENTGSGTLTGSASVAEPFSIVSGGSYSLGAGQSQAVTVSYSPTAAGTNSQTITFSGGAGASVTLNGTAVIPAPQNLQPHPPGS